MINTCAYESLDSIDYKSIALPAELQGLNEFVLIIFQLINTFLYSLNGEKQ